MLRFRYPADAFTPEREAAKKKRPDDTPKIDALLNAPWSNWEQDRIRGVYYLGAGPKGTLSPRRCPDCKRLFKKAALAEALAAGLKPGDLMPEDSCLCQQADEHLEQHGCRVETGLPLKESRRQSVDTRHQVALSEAERTTEGQVSDPAEDDSETLEERLLREERREDNFVQEPVLGRVPIPRGGFEPGALAGAVEVPLQLVAFPKVPVGEKVETISPLGLDGVAPSRQRKKLARRYREEREQLVWLHWRRREHFGIKSKAQLARHHALDESTIRMIIKRKEEEMAVTAAEVVERLTRIEAQQDEILTFLAVGIWGEMTSPSAAAEQILAESTPEELPPEDG